MQLIVYFFILLEQQRQNDRELRKAGRDLERDKLALEREEKKIVCKTILLVYKNLFELSVIKLIL